MYCKIRPEKGHNHLLDALSRIPSDVLEHVQVLIAGDGDEERLRGTGSKTESIYGLLFRKRDDVPAILNMTDIFVLPTINDSLPISIIEAMFSGSAIIATDCGVFRI